uniref:Uncharacterized protein n=1 Tax=Oryza sativa subsp. japonica TaxID=39947 RepID=Q2QNH4_ORYSJ|nr:hypothetical protein LOC_Os12g37800 [Oryza sativa Japonica Group]
MEVVWANDGGQATTSTDLAVRTRHCSDGFYSYVMLLCADVSQAWEKLRSRWSWISRGMLRLENNARGGVLVLVGFVAIDSHILAMGSHILGTNRRGVGVRRYRLFGKEKLGFSLRF